MEEGSQERLLKVFSIVILIALFDYFTTGPLVPMDITCIEQSMIAPMISVLTTKIELEAPGN